MLVSPGLPPERGECVARERSRSPPALLLARAVSALFAVARTTARDARGRGGSLRVSEPDVSVTVISVVSIHRDSPRARSSTVDNTDKACETRPLCHKIKQVKHGVPNMRNPCPSATGQPSGPKSKMRKAVPLRRVPPCREQGEIKGVVVPRARAPRFSREYTGYIRLHKNNVVPNR